MLPLGLVVFYITVSPVSRKRDSLLSVALSVVSRRLVVYQRPALWSPDLPQFASSLKVRPTAVIQPTHRRHQLYRRLSTLTREALIYSNNDPRLGDQRPPKTPPSVARETASNDANIRPNHDTERIPRANRMHCVASPTSTAGLAVSIP